jgi:hypothetical protein
MLGRRFCAVLAAVGGIGVAAALAASFTERTVSIPGLTGKPGTVLHVVRLTGLIEQGDSARLRAMLRNYQTRTSRPPDEPLATIELSSLGGDVLEALKLGYLFREFDVATVVRANDLCLSACALAFLGGTASRSPTSAVISRTVERGAVLAFHNYYLNPDHPRAPTAATPREGLAKGFLEAQAAAALLVQYAVTVGIDPVFMARLLGRPPEAWEYADTAGDFIDLGICPAEIERPAPPASSRAVNICNNAIGSRTGAGSSQVVRYQPLEAKRRLLQHVQGNVAALSVKSQLASQLAAVLATRDSRLVDAVYADLRAADLPLPDIVGPTFEVRGYTGSLSLDDPDRFDLALTGPMGLTRASRQPPRSCGRLFSYDREEPLNPTRN